MKIESIKIKFIIYILPLILIISLSYLAFFIDRSNHLVDEELTELGFSLVKNLAYSSELAIASEEEIFLKPYLGGIFRERDVISITVYNRRGHIIASRKKAELEERLPKEVMEELIEKRGTLKRVDYTGDGEQIYNFYSPILISEILAPTIENETRELAGFARVGLSLERMHKQGESILLMGLGVTVLVIFFSAGITVFLAEGITKPIEQLSKGADTIAKGNLDYRIKIETRDEIGVLADDFNEMTKNLKKADTSLKEKIKELEEYIDVTSHDLQQPLATIQAYSMLLKGTELNPESLKKVEIIESQANFMRDLLNDLLDYSRTKEKLPFRELKTGEILDEVKNTLSHQIEEDNADIRFRDIPDRIIGQEKRITQLFRNLIGNALKYTDEKPVIEVGCRDRGEDYLFWVKDNGRGIEERYYKKIFKPFWKLGKGPGTGMGLAICKTIVENHGGRIWVESEPGRGSTFYFTLPKRKQGDKYLIHTPEDI